MNTQVSDLFLAGNELPHRWHRRERFVILETGFGVGHTFMATWQAWRDDPSRCERLVVISIAPKQLTADDIRRAHANLPSAGLAAELVAAWPPLTPNLHSLQLEQGKVQLLLARGDVDAWLPELVARVDAICLDGSAWQPRMFKALARLAAPEATLVASAADSRLRDGLRTAGFELRDAAGEVTLARYAPRFTPRPAPSRSVPASSDRRALIVGAGLAGCASAQGLLRLDGADASSMTAALERLGLPADYVQALTPAQASSLSGITLQQSAWFYPGGGSVEPGRLAAAWMARAGPHTRFWGGVQVARLNRRGNTWQLLDNNEHLIDEAEVVVLANAGDALRLLGHPAWPIEAVRGQISLCDNSLLPSCPKLPIAGAGYLLPDMNGMALFGASSQPGDMDGAVRDDDHRHNLAQLARLIGRPVEVPMAALQGRVGWRWVAQDKLPVIGAVPADMHGHIGRPLDQPRLVPRSPGLYVFTALGSRGITWSPLGARVLASLITGAPSPLEASLLDAIDPARFVSRAARGRASREARRTPAGD